MLKVERQDEGKRLTAETPRTPSGGREMRFTTVHRRLRTVTEDTEEDGVSLTQRREEECESPRRLSGAELREQMAKINMDGTRNLTGCAASG